MRFWIALGFVLPLTSFAQSNLPPCPSGQPRPTWPDCHGVTKGKGTLFGKNSTQITATFEGDFRNGQRHGRGIVNWYDKGSWQSSFEGEFSNGKALHGIARNANEESINGYCHNPSETTFVCSFRQAVWSFPSTQRWETLSTSFKDLYQRFRDSADGPFELIERDGVSTTGMFKQGKPSELADRDVHTWKGQFANGLPVGKVEAKFSNGMNYQGQVNWRWSDRSVRLEGTGSMSFPGGDRYEGEFKDGVASGRGRYVFRGGSTYTGHFKSGLIEGFGRFVFADGRVFVGEHQQGKGQGDGVLYSSQGKVLSSGYWESNQLKKPKSLDLAYFSFGDGSGN